MNEHDIELLSAYIDNQLSEPERDMLLARLQNEPDLQKTLASLQATVALLGKLPTLKAPRAYVLTPEMLGQALPTPKQSKPHKIIPLWTSLSSVAAALLFIVFGASLLLRSDFSPQSAGSGQVTHDTVAPEVAFAVTALPTLDEAARSQTLATEIIDTTPSTDIAEVMNEIATTIGETMSGGVLAETGESQALFEMAGVDALDSEEVSTTLGFMTTQAPSAVMSEFEEEPAELTDSSMLTRERFPEDAVSDMAAAPIISPEVALMVQPSLTATLEPTATRRATETPEPTLEPTSTAEPTPTEVMRQVETSPSEVDRPLIGYVLLLIGVGLLVFAGVSFIQRYRRKS